jgi:hypothetical protein
MFDELKNTFSGALYYKDLVEHNAVVRSYAADTSVYPERPVTVLPLLFAHKKRMLKSATPQVWRGRQLQKAKRNSADGNKKNPVLLVQCFKHFQYYL